MSVRLLCIFVAMTFCHLTHAFDFFDRSRGSVLYYNIVSDQERTCEITHGDEVGEFSGSITIPRSVRHKGRRYKVTAVGREAFAYCEGLTSITFTSNITRIDSAAFCGCVGIYRLKLPKSL